MRILGDLTLVERKNRIALLIVIALITFTTGVLYVQRDAVYDQLYSWKLIPRPERLTELYFTDHRDLPVVYTPGQQHNAAFTVRNLEHRRTTYNYTITQQSQDGQQEQQLASGEFTLDHDESTSPEVSVTLSDYGQPSRIVVTVTYEGIAFGHDQPSIQTQAIHYWVREGGENQ